jgi:methyltransferase-like protein/SAM-dependent methyltransferase
MPENANTSYEDIPYESKPLFPTHPNNLATVATLYGMQPQPVDKCRVLELGCASGGNLIPMAETLPRSQFVGIDLSPSQIADGQATVRALQLPNIELKALSILDVDESFGQFDYIVCHGVYSWVPPAVQEKILQICRANLTTNGVAYVSYNTYPGWHLRGMIRDMMLFHLRNTPEPAERVRQARAFLEFLVKCVRDPDSAYGMFLKEEAELLRKSADSYLFHEHLEDANSPVYFHEFMARASAAGLQFLGEARLSSVTPSEFPADISGLLQTHTTNLIEAEQYLDFLRSRTFRRTLLCHRESKVDRSLAITQMALLRFSSPVVRVHDDGTEGAAVFKRPDGVTVSTSHPFMAATLQLLGEAWPEALPFDSLWDQVQTLTAHMSLPESMKGSDGARVLAEGLLHCSISEFVHLHTHVPHFVREISDRPVASPLARLQAESTHYVSNLRHQVVDLSAIDREVIRLLDGRHDRLQMLAALEKSVSSGVLTIVHEGQPIQDVEKTRIIVRQSLEPSLRLLALSVLLIG